MGRATSRYRGVAIAMALTAALLVSACNGDSDDETDPHPVEPSPTTATTSPPTTDIEPTTEEPSETETQTPTETLSPEEQDEADIDEVIGVYWAALDGMWQNTMDTDALDEAELQLGHVTGAATQAYDTRTAEYGREGFSLQVVQEGDTAVEVLEVVWLDDDEAEVQVCVDRTGVTRTGPDGESSMPDKPERVISDLGLTRASSGEHPWRVTQEIEGDEACDS